MNRKSSWFRIVTMAHFGALALKASSAWISDHDLSDAAATWFGAWKGWSIDRKMGWADRRQPAELARHALP
jgi:hypothetical protein